MILLIGARAAGKRTYAQEELGFAPEDIAEAVMDDRPAVCCVQRMVAADTTDEEVDALAEALSAKHVVMCDEVGSGVVPIDFDQRAWRDKAGRLASGLARRADVVVRLVCGIPVKLKG